MSSRVLCKRGKIIGECSEENDFLVKKKPCVLGSLITIIIINYEE